MMEAVIQTSAAQQEAEMLGPANEMRMTRDVS